MSKWKFFEMHYLYAHFLLLFLSLLEYHWWNLGIFWLRGNKVMMLFVHLSFVFDGTVSP